MDTVPDVQNVHFEAVEFDLDQRYSLFGADSTQLIDYALDPTFPHNEIDCLEDSKSASESAPGTH